MNIFYLDHSPKLAARYHCNAHVVKMILELGQILSTAHRVLDGKMVISNAGRRKTTWVHPTLDSVLYKATHVNHPSAVWCRETSENYSWTYSLFKELCIEYTVRYNKVHESERKLGIVLASMPTNITYGGLTPIAQAMPDYCKDVDPVEAYRDYYAIDKQRMLRYTNRSIPSWLNIKLSEIAHDHEFDFC